MPRSSKVEACIFCGSLPCACHKPAKPGRPKVKEEPKQAESSQTRSRFKASPRPVQNVPLPEPEAKSRFDVEDKTESQDDLELKQAIRNLEPLLSEGTKRTYKHILDPALPATVERRLIDWRARNAKG